MQVNAVFCSVSRAVKNSSLIVFTLPSKSTERSPFLANVDLVKSVVA